MRRGWTGPPCGAEASERMARNAGTDLQQIGILIFSLRSAISAVVARSSNGCRTGRSVRVDASALSMPVGDHRWHAPAVGRTGCSWPAHVGVCLCHGEHRPTCERSGRGGSSTSQRMKALLQRGYELIAALGTRHSRHSNPRISTSLRRPVLGCSAVHASSAKPAARLRQRPRTSWNATGLAKPALRRRADPAPMGAGGTALPDTGAESRRLRRPIACLRSRRTGRLHQSARALASAHGAAKSFTVHLREQVCVDRLREGSGSVTSGS